VDISDTTTPKSDQQNFDDYLTGPKTVTISEIRKPGGEQPVHIHLAEFPGRPYKPSKSMRRVLVAAWGKDGEAYVGRSMTLYGDPNVKYAGQKVGGVKISHLSHIDKPMTIVLTEAQTKRAPHTVKPLETPTKANPKPPTSPVTPETVAASTDINPLREWQQQIPAAHDAIEQRIKQIAAEGVQP